MNSQDIPVHSENNLRGRLLTASVTTGWWDWIHGELWLFPNGLLRIPLTLWTTVLHGTGATVNQQQPCWRNFDEKTFADLIASRRTRWVPRTHLRKAYLHRGIITDQLWLEVENQRTMHFLWLPWDGAWQPLQSVLSEWLGNEFVIDRWEL